MSLRTAAPPEGDETRPPSSRTHQWSLPSPRRVEYVSGADSDSDVDDEDDYEDDD